MDKYSNMPSWEAGYNIQLDLITEAFRIDSIRMRLEMQNILYGLGKNPSAAEFLLALSGLANELRKK